MQPTLAGYVETALRAAMRHKEYFTGPLDNDVFQFSALPWVPYRHILHTNGEKKDNATPLFDWGKYCEKDGRTLLPRCRHTICL